MRRGRELLGLVAVGCALGAAPELPRELLTRPSFSGELLDGAIVREDREKLQLKLGSVYQTVTWSPMTPVPLDAYLELLVKTQREGPPLPHVATEVDGQRALSVEYPQGTLRIQIVAFECPAIQTRVVFSTIGAPAEAGGVHDAALRTLRCGTEAAAHPAVSTAWTFLGDAKQWTAQPVDRPGAALYTRADRAALVSLSSSERQVTQTCLQHLELTHAMLIRSFDTEKKPKPPTRSGGTEQSCWLEFEVKLPDGPRHGRSEHVQCSDGSSYDSICHLPEGGPLSLCEGLAACAR